MKPRRRSSSFTLVEMLVVIAVFSLLVALLFSFINGTTGLWRQQSSKNEDIQEARAALASMSRDLYVALNTTNSAWFYSSATQLAFLTTLPSSAQGTNLDNGDICAVGYSWEWGANDTSGIQTNMSLYRYVSFSVPTYLTNIASGVGVSSMFASYDGTNTVRELVARNVSQFSVTCYTNDASGTPWVCTTPTVLPNMLNIAITTLNDRTATQLTTQAQWQNTSSPVIQQNQESFTLRIRPQGP